MAADILKGRKIILGVCGCIAAYKACLLVRELVKRGAEVKVTMTPSAAEFVSPLTFSTLSQNEALLKVFPPDQKQNVSQSVWHIENALWADLMIIAPASVNTVSKIANGFADNALTTLVMARRSPLLVCPSADVDMYESRSVRRNIEQLERDGAHILEAETGELASGLKGRGRFPEVEKIIETAQVLAGGWEKDLRGKKLLITAGPTYEDLDPVRFIGNRSSGKMGFSIAKAAFLRGADVTLITGPTAQKAYEEINVINVRSAAEMKNAVDKELKDNDVLVMAAAVADFKPEAVSDKKIKKDSGFDSIALTSTDDILRSLKKGNTKVIGFALETDDELVNAEKKLKNKNLDMIVMNSLREEGSGFEVDTNRVTIIDSQLNKTELPLLHKFAAANKILDFIKKN